MNSIESFLREVKRKADQLDTQSAAFDSVAAGLAELQLRFGRLRRAIHERDHLGTHRQLVTLLAQGCRLARDIGLLTEEDAVRADEAHR